MRTSLANKNIFAISANNRETGINMFQALDTTLMVDIGDVANLEPRREDNADEVTGMEEASNIYDNGALSGITLNFNKAQPQHFGTLMGYGLGNVATTAAGVGKKHLITPIADDLDINRSDPTFTGAMRYGTVAKKRFASFGVDSVNATFAADDWVKISGTIKGTGKYESNITEETLIAKDDATSITLAANGVQGATAAARADSVHWITAELTPGVWTEVAVSSVSDATPAVLNITPPGTGNVDISYRVIYVPTEPAWCAFPARISETPMRVSEMTCNIGGAWNGTTFSGGYDTSSLINTLEYSLSKNLTPKFAPGAGGAYASRMLRDARVQTLKINREMRDYIMQNHMDQNRAFGVRVLCEGMEFDTGHKYGVEMIFPKCGVLGAPVSVNGKRLAETGDLKVLQDDTYGSVICIVKNLVASYAA